MNTAADQMQVLLVGHSPETRRSAADSITRCGGTPVYAADGFKALDCLVRNTIDVIVAQAVMPRLDGYQMCALIKRNSNYHAIPVFLAAERYELVDLHRLRLVGSAGALKSNFTADDFKAVLPQALVTAESPENA